MRRLMAAALILGTLPACSLFTLSEPYRRWTVNVTYLSKDARTVATPVTTEVNGPRGEILLTNFTPTRRGFVIPQLAIFERVDGNTSIRIVIDGIENGREYRYRDDLHPEGPSGILRVRFLRRK